MGYELRAVIGRRAPLNRMIESIGARLVALTSEMFLLPWTDELFDRLGPDESSGSTGLRYLHAALVPILAQASQLGPIAYVEAEFFGGVGEQGTAFFRNGVLHSTAPTGPIQKRLRPRSPISQALHMLGVEAVDGKDEFDTIGLGRHRHLEDWA